MGDQIIISAQTKVEPLSTVEEQIYLISSDIELSDTARLAQKAVQRTPDDPSAWLALGNALKRQCLHREAIDAFSKGLCHSPMYSLLYRARGHAYLNIGRFVEAVADFEIATRIDPYNFDSWYHMGISYFILNEYSKAAKVFAQALKETELNSDKVCASYWYWIALMRADKTEDAQKLLDAIPNGLKLVACDAFYQVLMMCKGLRTPEDILDIPDDEHSNYHVISYYGVACYYYLNNKEQEGNTITNKIIEDGAKTRWSGFAYHAAEMEKRNRKN